MFPSLKVLLITVLAIVSYRTRDLRRIRVVARPNGLLVPRLQVGARHGGVDACGHGRHAAGGGDGAAGDGFETAGLQGEAEVHGFNGVADWAGAGQVEHVGPSHKVHGVAVLQAQREELVGVLLVARHLGCGEHARHVDLFGEVPGVCQDHAAAQLWQVGGGDHPLSAGDGDDDVGVGERLVAIGGIEAVEVCAQLKHWVTLDHRHLGVAAAASRPTEP